MVVDSALRNQSTSSPTAGGLLSLTRQLSIGIGPPRDGAHSTAQPSDDGLTGLN